MLRSRWIRIAAALAMVLAILIGYYAVWSARPGITLSNYSRLEAGMTQEQVEEFLGPPGFDAHDFDNPWAGLMFLCTPGGGRSRVIWTGPDSAVIVLFDQDGRLDEKSWLDAEHSLRAKIRKWVPWI